MSTDKQAMPQRHAQQTWLCLLHHAFQQALGIQAAFGPDDCVKMADLGRPCSKLPTSRHLYWMLLQAELQQQLADCTSANWEGFHIMQLKIQALVSWLCTQPQLLCSNLSWYLASISRIQL